MPLIESPFWQAEQPLVEFAETPLPAVVDVAVIGGGYTGLSAALHLAKSGASVAVLEQQAIGWGASSRNGGQVLTGLKHGVLDLIRRFGKERAQFLFQSSLHSLACVEALIREEQIDCDYHRCGHIEAAYKPGHLRDLELTQQALARDFGHPTQILRRNEQSAELDSRFYHGVLVDEHSGGLQPAKFVHGLAQAALRRGASLHTGTIVNAIQKEGTGFAVGTTRGTLRSAEVFVATNGYTGRVTQQLQRRIIPIGSYIIATAPLPPDLAGRLIPRKRMVFDTKNFLYYFRLAGENRMIFGGRAAFSPSTPATTRLSAEILAHDMVRVFPDLRGVRVEYAWGGTLGFTMDLYPHAGQMDGLWYAMGYAGHGVAMATYLGQQMALRMMGQPAEIPFENQNFRAVPFYTGNPWFLPFAAWWYKFLDFTR